MKPIVATYYLRDKDGLIVSKIEATDITRCLMGMCYDGTCTITDDCKDNPFCWQFVADVYCKFDGCTHWYFLGEGHDPDSCSHDDDFYPYYHLCGPECFIAHIRNMCFIWKVAEMVLIENYPDELSIDMIQENYEANGFAGEIVNKMLEDFTITKE